VKHGGLEKEVTVLGVRKKVEVWDRRRWQKLEVKLNATAEAAALRLSGSGDTSS
jgi:DNA-binding transcriptional regulator/RsmH inhibitor MraZ